MTNRPRVINKRIVLSHGDSDAISRPANSCGTLGPGEIPPFVTFYVLVECPGQGNNRRTVGYASVAGGGVLDLELYVGTLRSIRLEDDLKCYNVIRGYEHTPEAVVVVEDYLTCSLCTYYRLDPCPGQTSRPT